MEQSANFPSFLPAKNLTDKWAETYHADVDLVKNTMAEITDAELNNPDYVAMFGQKLKAERKSKNITLDQEANQLGINRTTILDMACLEDAPQTAQMVGNLGKIFKYSVKGQDMVPVREELSTTQVYLGIQQMRFEGIFRVEY